MGSVFHVSEDPDIGVFVPQSSGLVWAITADRLPNYLVPRDCPRVTFYALPTTTATDRERFLKDSTIVVVIESAWHARCESTALTVYEFDDESFVLKNATAGYYTTQETLHPVARRRIERPLDTLRAQGVEVRMLDSLWQLREDVAKSSLGFSIIRMRNARPPPPGFVSAFEVSPGPV